MIAGKWMLPVFPSRPHDSLCRIAHVLTSLRKVWPEAKRGTTAAIISSALLVQIWGAAQRRESVGARFRPVQIRDHAAVHLLAESPLQELTESQSLA